MTQKKRILTLQKKAEEALKKAVRRVIKEYERAGQPIVIWKNGKVVKISAKKILHKTGTWR